MPPLLVPLISLVLGILIAPSLDTSFLWLALPLALSVGILRPRYACLSVFLVGAGLQSCHTVAPPDIPDDGYPVRVTGVLESNPRKQGPGYYVTLRLESVGEKPWSGRARLSFFPEGMAAETLFEQLELGSGDLVGILLRLDRPTSYRNPGGFDYTGYLERRGIYWTGSIRSARLIEVLERGWHGLDPLRVWVERRVGAHFRDDPRVEALVLGMVLGQRRRLPAETARQFRDAGLIHLLVVSGFNLAIVAASALWLARQLRFGRHQRIWSRLFALLLIASYALLVEGETPVVRAGIMAGLLVIGTLLDRGYAIANALAATAVFILALNPLAIRDPSFQLTFAAVIAILLIAVPFIDWRMPHLPKALRSLENVALDRHLQAEVADWRVSRRMRSELSGWPLWLIRFWWQLILLLAEAAFITVSVQIVLLPLTVESYHRVSPVSLPLNVLGALTAALITPLGLVLIALPNAAAVLLAEIMKLLLLFLLLAVETGLRIPGATMRVPSPPGLVWIVYAVMLLLLAWALRRNWTLGRWLSVGALFGLQTMIVTVDFSPPPPGEITITFLDVGQGDSTLIELPDNRRIIIDGGGVQSGLYGSDRNEGAFSIGEDVVSDYLFSRGFRRLDVIVLTHAHHDHMDGLFDLIKNFQIGEVWLGRNPMVPRYRQLLDSIYLAGIPIRWITAGDTIDPFVVLNPAADYRTDRTVHNDDSVVLMLQTQHAKALLPGDFEGTLGGLPDRVEVLKIPHHGSRDTRLEVNGAVRIISVGARNSFGHPHSSKLPALRTDLLGAVRVVLKPSRTEVSFPGLEERSFLD